MKPKYSKVAHCRVCGSTNITPVGISKRYYLMNLDQTIDTTYAVCLDCQFIFQGEYIGDEYLDYYYKNSPMLRRHKPSKFELAQNIRQSDYLARHINIKGKRVLEIGAHAGAFLIHLYKAFNCQTYFNELSDEATEVLASQEGLADYNSVRPGIKMDLVVLRHVLEHIFDLDVFVNYIRSTLKPDGYLFIEVPDWSWLDKNTDPFVFEHINQFSTHNLIHLMQRLGLQCEALEKSIVADDPATPNRVQRLLFKPAPVQEKYKSNITLQIQEFYQEVYEQGNSAITKLIHGLDKSVTVALYPASHLTFAALNESELSKANIIGMFDIDAKKQGKTVKGIEIYPAEKLKDFMPNIILLFTMGYEREIKQYFDELGLTSEVISISQLVNDGFSAV